MTQWIIRELVCAVIYTERSMHKKYIQGLKYKHQFATSDHAQSGARIDRGGLIKLILTLYCV